MKKSSKFSKDFPTRKNHYAIRKFTVGTASIIVGSFLFSDKHKLMLMNSKE